jgi:hypothetical protein
MDRWMTGEKALGAAMCVSRCRDAMYFHRADLVMPNLSEDLVVNSIKLTAIYEAVRLGGKAWNDNARLKSQGEKRILVKTPDDPTINWEDWKKQPGGVRDELNAA